MPLPKPITTAGLQVQISTCRNIVRDMRRESDNSDLKTLETHLSTCVKMCCSLEMVLLESDPNIPKEES
jgi:hypothetical protein